MDNFIKEYIIAYFQENSNLYSFCDLANSLGISIDVIDDMVAQLIKEGFLEYNEDTMLSVTELGQLFIREKVGRFNSDTRSPKTGRIIDPKTAWPFDKIYVPSNFLSKL